ncbi:hypothetical protein, partial [Escherichia coli]|uniref:hypothetical protein n=1 Tax=Escherichia coli TaxID=562 RepID=UPI0019524E24
MITSIVDGLLTRREVLFHLSDMRTSNQALVAHSLNVCVLSLMAGITLGYRRSDLYLLGEG